MRDGDSTLTMWKSVRGSLISTADQRYAWVAFYSWETGSPYAKFVIIAVRQRSRSMYDSYHDVIRYAGGSASDQSGTVPATLEGEPVSFTINPVDSNGAYIVSITPTVSGAAPATPLAYLVVSKDTTNNGFTNGYVFRVGNQVATATNTWELIPGDDLSGLSNGVTLPSQGTGYIVGRGLTDPTQAPTASGYDGPAQDIAAYTTYIYMN
jgi:hypothetical protein